MAKLLLDYNDVMIALAEVIFKLLQLKDSTEYLKKAMTFPIIKDNQVGWVKYEFAARSTLHEMCCFSEKRVKFDAEIYWFVFPDQHAFLRALDVAENRAASS